MNGDEDRPQGEESEMADVAKFEHPLLDQVRAYALMQGDLVLQRRVILQDNSCAHFEAGNERVRVSHDERSVAGEEDPSVFSHNPSL